MISGIIFVKGVTPLCLQGNSNNFTKPKSSPVARIVPLLVVSSELTSVLSEPFGHIPSTKSPNTLVQLCQSDNLCNFSVNFLSVMCFPVGASSKRKHKIFYSIYSLHNRCSYAPELVWMYVLSLVQSK
jgi:hypothetical protein